MMTLDDIGQVLARLQRTDVTECEIQDGAQLLRVKFAARNAVLQKPTSTPIDSPISLKPSTLTIAAPSSGLYRPLHPLSSASAASGSTVRCGDHVGYVEVDSVFCAVVAPASGRLLSTLLQEGELIGFGQPVAELDSGESTDNEDA